jgi:hypothetical protein
MAHNSSDDPQFLELGLGPDGHTDQLCHGKL